MVPACFRFGKDVHKIVDFCLRFRYAVFKTKRYFNNRKDAEAVNRTLSNSVDPLFYLSSFQTLSRETPVPGHSHRGFSPLSGGWQWRDFGCSCI